MDGFADAAAAQGRTISSESILQLKQVPVAEGGALERFGRLRMLEWVDSWEQSDRRPDGLIVHDDILMRGLAQALAERGVKVPEDVEVVCETCEGVEHFYRVPVTRYEFSPRAIARELISVLWKRMTGESAGELPIRVKGKMAGS
jgi:DNA-binding LacI/PurR family transcriptional regulator